MSGEIPKSAKAVISVDVEDWFHSANLDSAIARESWDECESRVERNTMRMLDILESNNVLGTFFVLGWVAEKRPRLVRRIAEAGHEVASHGYGHQLVYSLTPEAFREDVSRSKELLEDLTGTQVRGYRAPCFSITDWAIPILQSLGFDYDSSAVPAVAHDRYGRLESMDARRPLCLIRENFHEVGISCIKVGSKGIPWGGGGYFRLLPYQWWVKGVRNILESGGPYVFYIHPWEIDPDQPRIAGLGAINNFRQRVGLQRCESRFATLVSSFEWIRICDLVDQSAAQLQANTHRTAAE